MNKSFVLVAVLAAAALTGIFSNTMAAYATYEGEDESETNMEQEIKQQNVESRESVNGNLGKSD